MISLPETQPSEMDQTAAFERTDEAAPEYPIHVLVVDDEPAVLRALRSLFRGSAYQLHLAGSGARALEVLSENPIDVILCDMRMPEMDGAAFLAEARRRFPEPKRIVLSGYAEPNLVIGVLNETGIFAYVNKPWDNTDLKMKVQRAAQQLRLERLVQQRNAELASLNQSLERKVRERTAQLEATRDRLRGALLTIEESYNAVVKMLAHLVELRMPAKRGSGQRVARTAVRLAKALNLPQQDIRDIETAALLRDLGLVAIPDQILSAPGEQMTQTQREQFSRHPEVGEIMLIGIPAMREVAAIIRSHLELYDGNGFPDGLAGEAIPLGARILMLANDYQNLLDGETTGAALTGEEAYMRLCRDSGHRYDPQLLDLLRNAEQAPTDNGQVQVEEVCALHAQELKPGMVLYDKLVSNNGVMLLAAGQRVTNQAIEAILRLERRERVCYLIYVYNQDDVQAQPGGD